MIISIDSSDDDDVPEGRAGSARAKHGMGIAASRNEMQDITQSDDGSVSSADSIWDKAGLLSMPIRCERVTGRLVSERGAMKGENYAAVDAADEEVAPNRREPDDVTNNKCGGYRGAWGQPAGGDIELFGPPGAPGGLRRRQVRPRLVPLMPGSGNGKSCC